MVSEHAWLQQIFMESHDRKEQDQSYSNPKARHGQKLCVKKFVKKIVIKFVKKFDKKFVKNFYKKFVKKFVKNFFKNLIIKYSSKNFSKRSSKNLPKNSSKKIKEHQGTSFLGKSPYKKCQSFLDSQKLRSSGKRTASLKSNSAKPEIQSSDHLIHGQQFYQETSNFCGRSEVKIWARYTVEMSWSWNFPARASPSYEVSELSRAELGHFNFRAETELTILTISISNFPILLL